MKRQRFVIELGSGSDLHGMDVTKAACRAVRDAVSRSCLCGLVEILGRDDFQGVDVEVLLACPFPDKVDQDAVLAELPVGRQSIRVVEGGMIADGMCVQAFGKDCSTIVTANAAITVFVEAE